MASYALTIFVGAFLLFQVQPLMGKYILPWFGGGPGVWTTCMMFFQVLLVGGYAYAHWSARWLKPRTQAVAHLALLAAAVALLPITPGDAWKPQGAGDPTLRILLLLGASLGLPYFVLSSTGPLIQYWFSRARPGASPYRLYALSNIGSLLALLSYPFFFETHFTRQAQASLWAWGLVAYALCCGFCAMRLVRAENRREKAEGGMRNAEDGLTDHAPRAAPAAEVNIAPSIPQRLQWLLLPACASVLLLAVTNKLCQDVAVIPFLWILPLALYLLSFIICFDSPRWYRRFPYTLALIAALAGLCWALFNASELPLRKQLAIYCGGLFICCMVCHGELYRLKPAPRHLTGFYLMIALGGALGGLFVAVGAPLLFANYYELHWGLVLCGLLFVLVCMSGGRASPRARASCAKEENGAGGNLCPAASEPGPLAPEPYWRWLACLLTLGVFAGLDQTLARLPSHSTSPPQGFVTALRIVMWAAVASLGLSWGLWGNFKSFRHWRFLACIWLVLGVAGLGAVLWKEARASAAGCLYQSRNFYGVLTIYEYEREDPELCYLLLQHGRITHGLQFTSPDRAAEPVSYYGPGSGIWLAVNALPPGPRRIGVVGLGTGTMAAFGRAGDYVRFYEINPQVEQVAASWFTYLANCPARVEVAAGDARLSMEHEPPQNFDLLVLDAFSRDAVAVHLLTKEACEVYRRHLHPEGVIAVHISNHFLNLAPVVVNLARHFNYKLASIDYEETDEEWWFYGSTWALLSHNGELMNSTAVRSAASPAGTNSVRIPLWTDDFASLFQILD